MNLAATALLALALGAPGEIAMYRLSVGPLEEDIAAAVLSVEVPGLAERNGTVLRRAEPDRKEDTIYQVEHGKDGSRIHWLVDGLKKGEKAQWILTIFSLRLEKKPRLTIDRAPDGSVAVFVDEKVFTRLVANPEGKKPYLYPVHLDGLHMTRRWPMEEVPGEERDHVHQKSFWFTHGDVNKVDFWAEGARSGRIRQKEVRIAEGGDLLARIVTTNEWLAPDGKRLLEDERELRCIDLGKSGRFIDVAIVLTASDGPVVFGDTKEGSFGIRLAETLREKQKERDRPGGRITNSRGQVGMKSAWGKPAEWVDYSGPVEGRTAGVAIFDHPASFRHPTTWHVRDYGLFAANPFGLKDFTGDDEKDGSHRLEKGQSIRFRYRVFLHPGDAEAARVAAAYRAYAAPPEVKVERVERAR